jgi:DNA-binding beta-propeller fold protein YncE
MRIGRDNWIVWIVAGACTLCVLGITLATGARAATRSTADAQGKITSTDVAVNSATGQVFAAFQVGERVEVVRTDSNGVEQRRWSFRPGGLFSSGVTSDIAVSPITEETVAAMARDHLIVKRFDRDGRRTDMWETGFTSPTTDLALQRLTRDMYLALIDARVGIVMMAADGVLQDAIETDLSGPYAVVAPDPHRQLFLGVAQLDQDDRAGTGARYDGSGDLAGTWPLEETPVAVAPGVFEDVYFATRSDEHHKGSIYRYMDDGRVVSQWQLGAEPTDIAVDSEGMIYVTTLRANSHMLAVTKYTPSGELRGHWMALARLYMPTLPLGVE